MTSKITDMALMGAIRDGIPWSLFDEIYSLRTYPQCRVYGLVKECSKVCEPGPSNDHGSNIFLLPGEGEYLRDRMAKLAIPYLWDPGNVVVVNLNQKCPYHINGVCSIHDTRPMVCRSYPVRCHKFGTKSLSVYSSMACPYGTSQNGDIINSPHHRSWIGAWKAIMPYVNDDWWTAFERACPSGMVHLGDVIDPKEEVIPGHMAQIVATPECNQCHGTGVTDNGDSCVSCLGRRSKRALRRAVMDKKNTFRT